MPAYLGSRRALRRSKKLLSLPPIALTRIVDLLFAADSQAAGRGTGTDSPLFMAGARPKAYPTKLATALRAVGVPASSTFVSEASNSGGVLTSYDPRVTSLGTFAAAGALADNLGGNIFVDKTGTGAFVVTWPDLADRIVIETPQAAGLGTIAVSVDGGAAQNINLAGATADVRTVIAVPLGAHTVSIARVSGDCYIQNLRCYNSAITAEVRVHNTAARGWSTADFLTADLPYRAFPAMKRSISDSVAAGNIPIVVISLGGNDLAGAALALATYDTNLHTLINGYHSAGAYVVMAVQMPIALTGENTFTQAQMRTTMVNVAAAYGVPLFRGDLALGSWEIANANGAVADNAHWKEPASDTFAAGLLPFVTDAIVAAQAKPQLAGAAPVIASNSGVFSVTSNAAFTNSPTSYVNTWLRDGAPIATGATYTKVAADDGHVISLMQAGTNAAGTGQARMSNEVPIGVIVSMDFSTLADGANLIGKADATGKVWAGQEHLAYQGRVYATTGGNKAIIPGTSKGDLRTKNYRIETQFKFRSAKAVQLCVVYVDSSNYVVAGYSATSGAPIIAKVVAGTTTVLATGSAYAPAADEVAAVRADRLGNAVALFFNGAQVATATLTDAIFDVNGNAGVVSASSAAATTTTGVHVGPAFTVTAL